MIFFLSFSHHRSHASFTLAHAILASTLRMPEFPFLSRLRELYAYHRFAHATNIAGLNIRSVRRRSRHAVTPRQRFIQNHALPSRHTRHATSSLFQPRYFTAAQRLCSSSSHEERYYVTSHTMKSHAAFRELRHRAPRFTQTTRRRWE